VLSLEGGPEIVGLVAIDDAADGQTLVGMVVVVEVLEAKVATLALLLLARPCG